MPPIATCSCQPCSMSQARMASPNCWGSPRLRSRLRWGLRSCPWGAAPRALASARALARAWRASSTPRRGVGGVMFSSVWGESVRSGAGCSPFTFHAPSCDPESCPGEFVGDIVGYGSGDEDLFRGADVRGEAAPPLSVEFRENVVEEEDGVVAVGAEQFEAGEPQREGVRPGFALAGIALGWQVVEPQLQVVAVGADEADTAPQFVGAGAQQCSAQDFRKLWRVGGVEALVRGRGAVAQADAGLGRG